ncbi:MAG: hypothetical protein LBF58_02065, partial [Deltaproteobacteria bacterium]|nr:hypothetical protein [Deltaproteobacteria bacterium]
PPEPPDRGQWWMTYHDNLAIGIVAQWVNESREIMGLKLVRAITLIYRFKRHNIALKKFF